MSKLSAHPRIIAFYYSFPIQLLVNHLKRNHLLLLGWLILFLAITESFGRYLGIPFLYLDPEYLNSVSFVSFAIMGIVLAGFGIAFHITSYIVDGPRFPFLGTLRKPFSQFSLNNSVIPAVFFVVYVIQIIRFQKYNEFATLSMILEYLSGLVVGYIAMNLLMYIYFRLTNKDIFLFLADTFNEKLKARIRLTRARVLETMRIAKKKEIRVDSYVDLSLKSVSVPQSDGFLSDSITKVFDQNHLNLVIIELLIFLLLLIMGIFRDYEIFQLPAAASTVLFFTIIVMFIGAFSYWFGRWAVSAALAIIIVVNFLVKQEYFAAGFKAFGLNYTGETATYSQNQIREVNAPEIIREDKQATLSILENWKEKQESEKPVAVFICTSGGGQRASLWTLNALQMADSLTENGLFDQTVLITGASGGMIGASYYREIKLRAQSDSSINPLDSRYLDNISKDNLNPIIFSFLVNDLFVKFQNFEYRGMKYPKDRGYSFEEQINRNTACLLDKPMIAYAQPEREAVIPMVIMGPTIINDGRKLFLSPHNVSYMNISNESRRYTPEGIDFRRFFGDQGSDSLRYLSALRMNATFPYITPNITLPSSPKMEIMDAGISDNFGISDALRFLFAFREWLQENTSGIVILSIRDSQRNRPIISRSAKSLLEKFSNPISSVYINFENLQDISNDDKILYSRSWYNGTITRIDLEYTPQSLTGDPRDIERASLSWHLTTREKLDIRRSIRSESNQQALNRLVRILD